MTEPVETTPRPKWQHNISFNEATWLRAHHIKSITHHWKFTGADTSIDWIEAHNEAGESRRVFIDGRELRFRPNHAGLLQLD